MLTRQLPQGISLASKLFGRGSTTGVGSRYLSQRLVRSTLGTSIEPQFQSTIQKSLKSGTSLSFQKAFETSRNISSLRKLWRRNDVNELTAEANAKPEDAVAQQNLLNILLISNPEEVLRRVESGKYASNNECKKHYVDALSSLKLMNRFEVKPQENGNVTINPSASGPLEVKMVTSKADRFLPYMQLLVGIAVPVALLYFLYNFLDDSKEEEKVQHAHHSINADKIKERFSDVKGVDEAKQELEEVVEYLKNPQKFTKLGAKLPKGVLLVGEPGTGKTLLARAVAGEAGVSFLYAAGSSFDEMFVGVGPRRIRDLFEDARNNAPCIIFLDELDAVGVARKYNMSGSSAKESTLNQLLTEMDGFKQTEGIMVIAATNLPETLDSALTRPGRFDKQVVVSSPDVVGRKAIIDLYLKKTKAAADVCSEKIARGTTGFTGAELFNLVNQAAIKAAVAGASEVDMKTIEEARDDIIMGGKKRGMVQTEHDKTLTAYHEGGHALVALYSEGAHPIHKATIIHRGNALGTTSFLPERDEVSVSRKQMISRLKVAMGGRAAEELIFGEDGITTGASSDFANATNLARQMVSRLGFSEKVGNIYLDGKHPISEREMQLVDSEVKTLLNQSYSDAKRILKEHEKELHLLAKGLLEHETLSAEDIKLIITGKSLPKVTEVTVEVSNNNTGTKKGSQSQEDVKISRGKEKARSF